METEKEKIEVSNNFIRDSKCHCNKKHTTKRKLLLELE